ncbi:inositol hexakisphosphate and diphosphoinositol-pentakisphosphate kinase 2 isoform X17 [Frieseomelitta varia]|uniref:inositol hexakisphosphate and diphosphoinositol-pentakisphosphate kinase 2 isoform X17 n=1 Tax=Frieseomelitta varia TaxID=561572 RepID=UPI001CB69D2C|nr:inositol hexakisphosphate and diphosphoinositol-pentakisphosphate kinase 2 isoform X17 [Frieseomelitta varia]
MSYTELEHGYQGLRSASRPIFYVGDLSSVQPTLVGPVASSIYRSSKRAELSDGCSNDDGCMGGSDLEGEGKQVLVGICAMAKKSQSKPMKEILTRLEEFEYIKIVVFPEEVILKESVEDWPVVDCLISFHSKGFPLDKAINYANLRNPFIINNLPMQYDIQDRRRVYAILESEGIEIPRYAVLDRDSSDPKHHELVESEDHVEVNGVTFNKPFVEKPVSAEDHNIYIYYPTSAGGGSQRLFRKIGSRSSVYSPESRVRKTGSYIYEDFMPTDGTDVKVYTVGPDYAHAEARKSPALDGKVERDSEGKEIRYPVILSNAEKLISRKVCLAFKQTVCGFDLLRANGQSFVCDVNGFSFVKNSNKYYDDCAKILGNMILRELAPTLHIPWSVPFQLDDPPIVPTTFGKMMELRCVVAVIRHGDRTPKQKMKVEVRHPKFFEIFAKYDGYKHGHIKLKRPKQLQEILDTARSLLAEIQHRAAGPELEEKQGKLEQLKSVLEMYGHFSGINRKVQMKYQPRGRPRGSSSDDDRLGEPSLVLILKWGGELTPAGRIQAEELGRIFRCMYPGGQGRHLSEEDSEMLPNHGDYAGAQGLGLLRLHSTFRHDLKIYASDEGRVQMTAAAFAKGLLALEGELTPILVQMVKSANTNGLLDNDCDSSKYQNMVKTRLHELLQQDREFTREDREQINPGNALSINAAMDFVKNPVRCCQHVHTLIQKLMDIVRIKKDDPKTKDAILYHGETWELMGRRWGKIEKDFCTKNKRFDISKIPDIYDCIKYDLQHNNHTLQFEHAEELYIYSKYLADIVIPQEYGLTVQEKLTIGQGICTPLLKKIRADLQRNIEESGEETVNRLNPRYSHGVSSPGRHVRTRLYFTSESHVHSLLTVLRYGGLLDVVKDEQWRRAMEYVSMVSELNYMSQIVVMLYEDPTKDPSSEERFHVELHFSPGVNCCVQKNLPPGPGFRPHSRNESSHNVGESGGSAQDTISQCSTRIEEEDVELGILEDDFMNPPLQSETPPPTIESDTVDAMDSPTTSRAVDMMDLHPNMMDEPFDSGFLQSSAPIPIRYDAKFSARTVAGHEAARLGSQLAASQRQRRDAERSTIVEPRARSYDYQRQDKSEKAADKLQYQSLDAVNKEDTRPSIIQPDPTCTARRHRHSISGQMSYFKLLGYSINKKLTGSANSLFSTAVISGSSSAPNLKDMVPPHASAVAAIEGFGGVPPIRPLETLHNALSLRQLDSFLEMMTSAPLFRTPASSPPKYPSPAGSTHESVNQNLSIGGISREYHSSDLEAVRYRKKLSKPPLYITPTPIQYKPSNDGEPCDIRNQLSPTSPNSTGWSSEPQSFLSSEPSSPAPTSTGECSMSISLISNDGAQAFNVGPKFPTTPCLDVDFNEFCINIDQEHREGRGSVSYTDYYSNEDGQIRNCGFGAGFNSNIQKIMRTNDDLPADNMDDDEDHTITLKQTEEQKKQDVKQIFEQKENPSTKSNNSSYKKIGRFLVESMEITDEDVRIKETDNVDKTRSSTLQKTESFNAERMQKNKDGTEIAQEQKKLHSFSSCKRKNFSRSQSVSMPKTSTQKLETNYSYKCTSKLSSLSNMSDEDLENWKQSMMESKDSCSEMKSKEPILTVASSMTVSLSHNRRKLKKNSKMIVSKINQRLRLVREEVTCATHIYKNSKKWRLFTFYIYILYFNQTE